MLNTLSFSVAENDQGVTAITPCIDGVALSDLVAEFERRSGYADPAGGYAGLIPDYFNFGPLDPYFSGEEEQGEGDCPGEIYVLACECGEVGCWPLMATVASSAETVEWGRFRQPHRPNRDYASFGPFFFERTQYQAAVAGLIGAWR